MRDWSEYTQQPDRAGLPHCSSQWFHSRKPVPPHLLPQLPTNLPRYDAGHQQPPPDHADVPTWPLRAPYQPVPPPDPGSKQPIPGGRPHPSHACRPPDREIAWVKPDKDGKAPSSSWHVPPHQYCPDDSGD